MLAVYFARNYPETTQVLALENPIGLEDYRSAIPPQPIETLTKTEMSQTPQSFRGFMAAFFVGWPPVAEHYTEIFSRVLQSPEYPRWARASALTYDMIFNEPIRHEYRLLKMPVLLVIGQSDRSVFFRRYAAPEASPSATGRCLAATRSRIFLTASWSKSPTPATSRTPKSPTNLMRSRDVSDGQTALATPTFMRPA